MAQFTTLTSRVVTLPNTDIDTDQIIPAQFLKVTDKNGLADALFFHWRYNDDKSPKPDFVLNRPESQGAQILWQGTILAAARAANTPRGHSLPMVLGP
jgi:3-isopropylmalate/(R)-2-methylmalate dehydratase small subunit